MRARPMQRVLRQVAWHRASISPATIPTRSFRPLPKRRPERASQRRERSWLIAVRLAGRRRAEARSSVVHQAPRGEGALPVPLRVRRACPPRPTADQPLLLARPFAFLDRRPLVVLLLALCKADVELHPSLAVMEIERHEGIARALALPDETADLALVQEERARARGVGAHVRRGGRERRDMRADQLDLAILDDHIR